MATFKTWLSTRGSPKSVITGSSFTPAAADAVTAAAAGAGFEVRRGGEE